MKTPSAASSQGKVSQSRKVNHTTTKRCCQQFQLVGLNRLDAERHGGEEQYHPRI